MSVGRQCGFRVVGGVAMTAVLLVVLGGSVGCASVPRLSVRAERYRLQVKMDPASHHLLGRAEINLARTDLGELPAGEAVAVELRLHPELEVREVTATGAVVARHYARRASSDDDEEFAPRTHVVVLNEPAEALTLFVDYEGTLIQDVAAGEIPGEVHNFEMRAHISEEGIYLGGDGYWYPEPVADEEAEPRPVEFTLIADPVSGLELVAGAQPDAVLSDQWGRLAWRAPYPVERMVLVGGPHEIHETTRGDVKISAHLKPEQARHAEGLLAAVKKYLDRYEPLVGPYPADEYRVVDNFFSSGFAFPTFTLLSSAVIDMGARAQARHGMLDHEMLHCWWGNGIHVDPRDGNWCEALTSYATNYYGYVLDGNEEGSRRKRRNYSHFLGRIKPEDDKPLATFGEEDGCGRGIGYSKGALVFHMLARKVGQETFWATMRRFTDEYVGKYASWDNIRRLFEEQSGMSLEKFFEQWVRGSGAPTLAIEQARYSSSDQSLVLVLTQGEAAFELDVTVRITHAAGTLDIDVPLYQARAEVTVPVDVVPLTVEVDPDYQIFRKIPLDQIVPTTAATRYGTSLTTVWPTGEVPESYTKLQSTFESSFDDEEDEHVVVVVGDIEEGELAESCLLILGEAVRDPYVAAFLGAIEFPVRWTDEGFEVADMRYTDPNDAVLATAAHPGVPGGGVTVLFANSADAIPNPQHVPYYDRSVVVFQGGRPKVRRDLEHRNIVPVEEF